MTAFEFVVKDLSDGINTELLLKELRTIILLKYNDSTTGLTKKITLPNLILLVENIIMPKFLKNYEFGYSKLTDDLDTKTKDVAMYGVTTDMLKADFSNIFANNIYSSNPVLKSFYITAKDAATGIQNATTPQLTTALISLMGSQFAPKIAGLFYYYHLTKAEYQTPIAIMAADPYLGFLAAEFTWTHSAKGLKFISDATEAIAKGPLGTTGALAKIIEMSNAATLPQTKLPDIAQEAISARIAAIPTEFALPADAPYKISYEARLINGTGCVLEQLVYITELFNKNGQKTYTFSAAEAALLKALADQYLTFSITLG